MALLATQQALKALTSFQIAWSLDESATRQENIARAQGFRRTTASVFPAQVLADNAELDTHTLKQTHTRLYKRLNAAFDQLAAPTSASRLSVGARALCKHYERQSTFFTNINDNNSPPKEKRERGVNNNFVHPFWTKPSGNEDAKNAIARTHLIHLLDLMQTRDPELCWMNIHQIHPNDTTIIELRNMKTLHGMRWTILFDNERDKTVEDNESAIDINSDYKIEFRGFLEP
ncbi:hypothetical protein HK100_000659 [Physocladia obscura]|uniref:Uncharacterized protein n=1 Tax=Physocladia obscura TaxID=109957 RepID=A0AAD5XGS5_9FUNG|nr:hypothetical protein HK100_000659 [Physocladia obscura]